MEEIQYYKTVYDKFWAKQTHIYGYAPYEQNLVRLIAQSKPKKVFEVGIGTGWPIGTALKEKRIKIDGCDVAESSVEIAKQALGNEEGIWSGEIYQYQGEEEAYDVVYCVRASWIIPNFYRVLKRMISMTKPGGYIVFDVMDKDSLYCRKFWLPDMKQKYFKFLGIDIDETFGHHFISIAGMKLFLRKNGLFYQCWGEREITQSKDIQNTPKVVFYCRKGK